MSSLFNYELDEKQIRLTLHDAELEYNHADWQDFDSNYSETASKTHKNPFLNLPKINLNINRNVLVPLFFIIGLGGVSAIMFKFINFKTKEPVNVQNTIIPSEASDKVVKKEIPPPEKKEIAPIVVPEVKRDTIVASVNTPTQTAITNTVVTNNNPSIISPAIQKNNTVNLVDTNKISSLVPPTVMVNQNPFIRKRKRRRVTAEQLDAIKAQPLLSKDNSSTETEPELKIKTKDTPPD